MTGFFLIRHRNCTIIFKVNEKNREKRRAVAPTITEWWMVLFVIFAGFGVLFYVKRQRMLS